MFRRNVLSLAALACLATPLATSLAYAQGKDIKIAHIYSKTGPLEAYGKHYAIGYPHEEYESGRPRIVSPLYQRLKARNAVFGSKLGWERANWFAPVGVEPRDQAVDPDAHQRARSSCSACSCQW